MSPEASIILDLTRRHMYATAAMHEAKRARLFRLLDDFEWAYPDARAEVEALYPIDHP